MTMTGRFPIVARASAKIRSRFGARLAEMHPNEIKDEEIIEARRKAWIRRIGCLGCRKWQELVGKMCWSVSSTHSWVASHLRLIKLATKPAPKPLSIFTTVTFEAQEFSIPNNAATPPKDAP